MKENDELKSARDWLESKIGFSCNERIFGNSDVAFTLYVVSKVLRIFDNHLASQNERIRQLEEQIQHKEN